MCGFAGFAGQPGDALEHAAVAARMAATLVHRGPDDDGSWADATGEVAFGFRRLSILDLTPEGHQPMVSADGRYALVLNGEIYDYLSLRKELQAEGHAFRGHSDTEVLLAAISRLGLEATLPRIGGMFAFALWDSRERVLHLVRDRLGKKPLYYGWQGKTLLFGSELKALRAHPAFQAEVDRDALASYLRFCYVPGPRSIYRGIFKLPPGTWLSLRPDRRGETAEPRRYWDGASVARGGQDHLLRLDDEEAVRRLEHLLLDAVRLRTISDVPLGAFLSGGIDSSTVVALLQAQSQQRVRTFTIGFDDPEYDESPNAAEVARHLGTDHTELRVTPREAQAIIPSLATIYDEPFADASQIPTLLVSRLARESVTVALSGDGGDEVFGGYNRYVIGPALWRRVRHVPALLRRAVARAAIGIPPSAWDGLGRALDHVLPPGKRKILSGNRLHKLAGVLDVTGIDDMYRRLVSMWQEPDRLVREGNEPPLPWTGVVAEFADPAHRMMILDLLGYLPDDILVKVDRASMGVGLEARAPLLDHRVVEFAWRLPIHQKIRDGEGKWLLRRVLERYVPRSLFERPKQGFGVPIDAWLRGPLEGWARDLLAPDRLRREGYLEPAPVEEAFQEHVLGRRNHQYNLWAVLMFQSWLAEQRRGGALS